MYGPIWLIVTYVVVLGFTANLNDYFSLSSNNIPFTFVTPYLGTAMALNAIFRGVEIFVYPSIMGCLDGELSNTEVHLS